MRRIDGKCHCGNISYEFLWPEPGSRIPVRACSCSFCIKHGAVYTSHPDSQLMAQILDPVLVNKYSFDTKTADFYVCSNCGAVPCATSKIEGNEYAVVNVNTFEGVDSTEFDSTVTDFAGERVGGRLDRRKRRWIPRVTVETKRTR